MRALLLLYALFALSPSATAADGRAAPERCPSARVNIMGARNVADRVWENNKLQYSYFPGGYFDADGGVHYLHNDYQGSVVLVTDSTGTIEQRNTYYPYGEPHRTPAGQPILYGGKEHDPVTGEYNYDARRLFAPMLIMTTPDPLAGRTPQFSPYVFCAANPVKYIDITGQRFTPSSMSYVEIFRAEKPIYKLKTFCSHGEIQW